MRKTVICFIQFITLVACSTQHYEQSTDRTPSSVASLASDRSCTNLVKKIIQQSPSRLTDKKSLYVKKAPTLIEVIAIDDVESISKKDPFADLNYRDDINLIRSKSGRLRRKYVIRNPELEGSLKEAFDGPIEQMTFYPGQVIWQIQRSNQENSGRWFSTDVPKNRDEAEELFNLAIWNNDRGQMRMFIVKDEFTAYTGRVAGGRGNQVYIGTNIPVDEVVKPVTFKITSGGEVFEDVEKIPAKTLIEATITYPDGTSDIHQGLFLSAKISNTPKKFGHIRLIDTISSGVHSLPVGFEEKLVVRSMPSFGAKAKTPYPISWSKTLDNNTNGPVEFVKSYVDPEGVIRQERVRGVYEHVPGQKNIILTTSDNGTVSFPARQINREFSYKLDSLEQIYNQPVLNKKESFISNLISGDKIKFQSVEKDADGSNVTHTFTGEYVGITSEYLIVKRAQDIAPIFVLKYDIPDQKVTLVSKAPSKSMPTNLKDEAWKWTQESPAIEVTTRNIHGEIEVKRGFLFKDLTQNKNILIKIGDELTRIPVENIVENGLRLIRAEVD